MVAKVFHNETTYQFLSKASFPLQLLSGLLLGLLSPYAQHSFVQALAFVALLKSGLCLLRVGVHWLSSAVGWDHIY